MRQQISLNAYQKDQSIGTIICNKSELQGRYRLNKKCQIFTRQSRTPSSPTQASSRQHSSRGGHSKKKKDSELIQREKDNEDLLPAIGFGYKLWYISFPCK